MPEIMLGEYRAYPEQKSSCPDAPLDGMNGMCVYFFRSFAGGKTAKTCNRMFSGILLPNIQRLHEETDHA